MKDDKKIASRTTIKHAAILTAAKKVFLKQGYRESSMDEIARQANVSKRTIYDHFCTKKQLFESMLQSHWEMVSAKTPDLFKHSTSTIADQLKQFSCLFFEFLYHADTIALFRLLISEANEFSDLTSSLVTNEKAPFTRALIEFLTSKKISGELIIENPDQSAAYLMGMLKEYHFWPMMLGFSKQKKISDVNAFIDNVVSAFLKTCE
jgi:AcrR family transcriptional regulator